MKRFSTLAFETRTIPAQRALRALSTLILAVASFPRWVVSSWARADQYPEHHSRGPSAPLWGSFSVSPSLLWFWVL